jgi:FkbH-like protein
VKPYAGNEPRVLDLIAKTNQFNTTTRRYGREALESKLSSGGELFVFELDDKFGGYGIIALVLALPIGGDRYDLDLFLMSCRVIGRKVEQAMLDHVSRELRKKGAKGLRGEFIPSKKNQLVAGLFDTLGFRKGDASEAKTVYELDFASHDAARLAHFCRIEKA